MTFYSPRSPSYVKKMKILTTEFYAKIAHDFNRYIFLGLKSETREMDEVIRMASSQDGYEGHKAVLHGKKVAHFYIRFRNAECAKKAIIFFRTADWMFNAVAVDRILLRWYIFEMTQVQQPSWTTAHVDVVGERDQSALETKKVHSVLRPFGYCRIPFKEGPQTKVEVLFMTFAEALASTIALGSWKEVSDQQSNVYRVKIASSTKEVGLFSACGSSPYEAFELDYFVTPTTQELNALAPEYIQAPKPDYPKPKHNNNKQRRTKPRRGNVVLDNKSS